MAKQSKDRASDVQAASATGQDAPFPIGPAVASTIPGDADTAGDSSGDSTGESSIVNSSESSLPPSSGELPEYKIFDEIINRRNHPKLSGVSAVLLAEYRSQLERALTAEKKLAEIRERVVAEAGLSKFSSDQQQHASTGDSLTDLNSSLRDWLIAQYFTGILSHEVRLLFRSHIEQRCNTAELDAIYETILKCNIRGRSIARVHYIVMRRQSEARERILKSENERVEKGSKAKVGAGTK